MFSPGGHIEGDPRSPRDRRRVTYIFSPRGRPTASNIERGDRAQTPEDLTTEEFNGLYDACYQLCMAVESQDPFRINTRRQAFVAERESLRSRAGGSNSPNEISWIDSATPSDGSRGSPRSRFPIISSNGSGSGPGSIYVHSVGSGSSVVYESDESDDSRAYRLAMEQYQRDLERIDVLYPLPVQDMQIIWMMTLDEYDEEMILTGMRGFTLVYRRGIDYDHIAQSTA